MKKKKTRPLSLVTEVRGNWEKSTGVRFKSHVRNRSIGGSRGGVPGARPLRVQILSFRHTKFSKCNRLGSQRPPTRSTPPYGKSWIRHWEGTNGSTKWWFVTEKNLHQFAHYIIIIQWLMPTAMRSQKNEFALSHDQLFDLFVRKLTMESHSWRIRNYVFAYNANFYLAKNTSLTVETLFLSPIIHSSIHVQWLFTGIKRWEGIISF